MERALNQRKFSAYRKLAEQLISQWATYSPDQQNWKASANTWSLTEVMFHLEVVHLLALDSMQARLRSGKFNRASLKHDWRFLQLKFALLNRKRFIMPASLETAQQELYTEHWDPDKWQSRFQPLEVFLRELPRRHKRTLLFKHPLAGPLTAGQAVSFLNDHLIHHRYQIERIVKHPGFPRS